MSGVNKSHQGMTYLKVVSRTLQGSIATDKFPRKHGTLIAPFCTKVEHQILFI